MRSPVERQIECPAATPDRIASPTVGPRPDLGQVHGALPCFVEADTAQRVGVLGLDNFAGLHARVCRPVSLSVDDAARVAAHALARIGDRCELCKVLDLARYLMPTPPVPLRWRRRLLMLGSGDPTRAICSTLIAQAFESVRCPIMPVIERRPRGKLLCPAGVAETLHVRHHSLDTPRDFGVSPYFAVVKPTLADGFSHQDLRWHDAIG